jgi:hypothetical protein
LVTAVATLPLLAAGGGADTVLSPADRSGLSLLVTQEDTALVRDRRPVTLEKGTQTLVVEGVARRARESSGWLTGTGIGVVEQSFQLAGPDADSLLSAAVGQEATVVWRDSTGAEREERAKVISAGPQPVFQVGGKVVAGVPSRILYDALPADIRLLPAYRASLSVDSAGKREVELAYLTGGLSWQADYVAEINPAEDAATLSAWATLTNTSGADFTDARVQVMAGDVNTVADAPVRIQRAEKMLVAAAMAPSPTREALGGYHLYALPQPVTLKDGERKQVSLMAPVRLAAERVLVLDPMPPSAWRDRAPEPPAQHPAMVLKLKNGAQPLPAGTIRAFQRAKDGAAIFLGEDRLPAIPANTSARATLGRAFDVTVRRSQTDFTRIAADITEAEWQIKLANSGDSPAKVIVRESFGGDWLVLAESARHTKESALVASWTVMVPAKGETMLEYRARVKGPSVPGGG